MGKECAKRPCSKIMKKQTGTIQGTIPSSVFGAWTTNYLPKSVEDIKENGRIVVIIREKNAEKQVLCSGFNGEGNSLKELVKKLILKGRIARHSIIYSAFILKPDMWTAVDVRTATFAANGSIMLYVGTNTQNVGNDKCGTFLSITKKAICKLKLNNKR